MFNPNSRLISEILAKNGVYTDRDLSLFEQKITFRKAAKDDLLLREGEVCRSIFFNLEGAVYQYRLDEDLEQNVIDLHVDQEWFLNHRSFTSQKPSDSVIAAYADSAILELTVESLHSLIAESPAFLQLGKVLEQATARVHFFDHRLTPDQKYQYILDHRPELIQKFPLKIIASYLKITPETLSRVRERFSRG